MSFTEMCGSGYFGIRIRRCPTTGTADGRYPVLTAAVSSDQHD